MYLLVLGLFANHAVVAHNLVACDEQRRLLRAEKDVSLRAQHKGKHSHGDARKNCLRLGPRDSLRQDGWVASTAVTATVAHEDTLAVQQARRTGNRQ